MQKEEFIQRAAIAAMHACFAQGANSIDSERIVAVAKQLADKVFEIVPIPEAAPAPAKKASRKKITDTSELVFPFTSEAFMKAWNALIQTRKWKKKEPQTLQYNLNKLAEYEEEFAIELISTAIRGDYQGLVFETTAAHYQRWLAEHGKGSYFGVIPETSRGMQKPSKFEQNARAAAEAAQMILCGEPDIFNGTDEQ